MHLGQSVLFCFVFPPPSASSLPGPSWSDKHRERLSWRKWIPQWTPGWPAHKSPLAVKGPMERDPGWDVVAHPLSHSSFPTSSQSCQAVCLLLPDIAQWEGTLESRGEWEPRGRWRAVHKLSNVASSWKSHFKSLLQRGKCKFTLHMVLNYI